MIFTTKLSQKHDLILQKDQLTPFGYSWFFRPILQSVLRGGKTIFSSSKGHPQQNVLKGEEFLGMGLPEDILGRGQKTKAGGA